MRIWLSLIAAALVLSGCATVPAPEPGFSPTELVEMRQRMLDQRWHWTGLPDELRPPNPQVQTIAQADWADFLANCMNEAGFDNYEASGDGLMINEGVLTADEKDEQTVAYYLCESSMVIEEYPEFSFNQKQLDYVFEYYSAVLVPCLEVHDVHVFGPPTKEEFDAGLGSWNPYWSVKEVSRPLLEADASIFVECPVTPPGIPDFGTAAAYGH